MVSEKPPYAGDTYEQSPLGVMPTKTIIVFLFLYVLYVDCLAFANYGFLIKHSVPSRITLFVVYLALKPPGVKKHTISQSGHRDTSLHCNDMKQVHV